MENETVCYCSGVTKAQIVEAVGNGAKTLRDIQEMTGACTVGNCAKMSPKKRCCAGDIVKILDGRKD